MIKKLCYFFIIVVSLLTNVVFATPSSSLILKRKADGGILYQKNHINIVVLHGNYYQMGKQYGALLKPQINWFYHHYIEKQLIKNKKNYQKIEAIFGKNAWQSYPARIQQLFLGMSKTTGLSPQQLLLIDQNFMLSFITYQMGMCSTLATWHAYTKNGEMIIGHNLDWMPIFQKQFSHLLTVIIFKPTDGSHAAVAINYAGGLYPITGLNDQGLYINVHDGSGSMGTVFHTNRMMYIGEMLSFLWNSSSLSTLNKAILTTRANFPMIINAASPDNAYVYEDAPQHVIRRENNQGLLVATNHYVSPTWGLIDFPSPSDSHVRYQHLMQLATQYKGKITVPMMQHIMSLPLLKPDGKLGMGATEYPSHKKLPTLTAYQVIAVPEQLKIWLRVPQHTPWTAINLAPFLN